MDFTFIISYGLIYIVLSLLFLLLAITSKKYSSKMTRNDFIIRYPKLLPIILFLCSLFSTGLVIFMSTIGYNETVTWWSLLFFVALSLLSLIAMYTTSRIKLIIKNNDIIYYPAFGKVRALTFNDITSVKYHNSHSVTCYNNNKRIFNIDFALLGYDLFLSRIKDKPLYTKKK